MSTQNSNESEYQTKLKSESETLLDCQKSNSVESCWNCEQLFNCEKRKKYVKTVYESMSHGDSGGFEF